MHYLSILAVILISFLHFLFMVLEMFYWKRPMGRKIFGLEKAFADQSASLAANQGLYNGFLCAGLIWGILSPSMNDQIITFFLTAVIIAGIFGAITVNRKIFWIQALPGIIALLLLFF